MTSKKWNENDFLSLFVSSAGFARDRDEIKFSDMCEKLAAFEKKKSHQIFEEFVSDWASLRFFGERVSEPSGQPTADTIIVRMTQKGKRVATVIQAKHYKNPKQSIPTNLYLRDLTEAFNLDEIEKYVFVVSTSDSKGWQRDLWHYEDERKVRNLIPDKNIQVIIVTEPELQTDVILNDSLFFKYFSYMLPTID